MATLISATPLAWSADETPGLSVTWANATELQGGANALDLKIGVELAASGFYHDVDDAYLRDAVYRTITAASFNLPTAAAVEARLNAAAATWYGINNDFADGILVEDAEIYLTGSAYDRIVFGLQLDADFARTAQIDKWYMGIKGIPVVGTLTLREVDNYQTPRSELFYEHSIALLTLEPRELIGVQAENEFLDGRLGYLAAVGMASGEQGTTDGNYEVQASVYGTPLKTDKVQMDIGVYAELINPSPNNHIPYSDTLTYNIDLGLDLAGSPTLVTLPAATEDAISATLWTTFTMGKLFVGGEYTLVEANAPDTPDLEASNLMSLLALDQTTTVANPGVGQVGHLDVYNDYQASGGTIAVAYSLTGEPQEQTGGIAAPHANLAFDGTGYGAFEVVGRYSFVDIQDNARDVVQQLNPLATVAPTINDVYASIIQASTNRQEGGKAYQLTGGMNWYPTPGMRIGLYLNRQNWEYDSGALTGLNTGMVTATTPVLNTSNAAALMTYVVQSQIENDYSVDSIFLESTVCF